MIKLPANLISIPPAGVGTPLVESLFSYLIRLAAANGVTLSVLVNYLAKTAGLPTSQRGRFNHTAVRSINAGAEISLGLVGTLAELTGLTNLDRLTLGAWSGLFAPGMVRETRWFDPAHSADYEPLLYSIKPVFWTEHGSPLERTCHACLQPSRLISLTARNGHCFKCGARLDRYCVGKPAPVRLYEQAQLDPTHREYHMWVTSAVGEMLSYSGSTASFSFHESLQAHLKAFGLDNTNAAARALGISKACIRTWMERSAAPRLDQFLKTLYCLGVGPVEFFTQKRIALDSAQQARALPRLREPVELPKRRKKYDGQELRQAIITAIRRKTYVRSSFRELCEKELKVVSGSARLRETELAVEFSRLHKQSRRDQARVLKAGRVAEIAESARLCMRSGLTIHARTIGQFLSQPGIARSSWVMKLIYEIRDFGIESALENFDFDD